MEPNTQITVAGPLQVTGATTWLESHCKNSYHLVKKTIFSMRLLVSKGPGYAHDQALVQMQRTMQQVRTDTGVAS